MKNVLSDEKIRKEFLKGAPLNDSKVVKAFVAANAANALKTRPKVSYSDILFSSLSRVFCMWLSIASLSIVSSLQQGLVRDALGLRSSFE